MQFYGTVFREQGIRFAVVLVEPSVFQDKDRSYETRKKLAPVFPGMPIILMCRNSKKTPVFQGRGHIVDLLEDVDTNTICWDKYTVS